MDSSDDDEQIGSESQSQRQAVADQKIYEEELDEKYPNKPQNRHETLPFHTLFQDLFNPLISNHDRKQGSSRRPTGRQAGPDGGRSQAPREIRRSIIERFISRWRREVGDDIFPAMRLIIPEKDRERAMYGLKEKALGRYIVKILKIDRNSEDARDLLNWKLPGQSAATRKAGDFAGRCFEVLKKRAYLIEPGNMTIGQVNDQLDQLSAMAKEEHQLPIIENLYRRMNPEEMMWLIRIILRAMRVGATEKTILEIWHPDAEKLFNVSSSLRRVCWELHDPNIRLEHDSYQASLMSCFQPQLASPPKTSFSQVVASMRPTEEDSEFWIEEKLDGERMQLHMISDPKSGNKQFRFWSRKGKDYTYLYGSTFDPVDSALTQYIKHGFKEGVENAILDGEMITWNNKEDVIVPFGSLKTAAIKQQTDPLYWQQPLFRVFDILLLNDQLLTRYTLRDRRKALEATINDVHRRIEVVQYSVGTSADEIEPKLREVVANASEGLVLKNPRSAYKLNDRSDNWVKVKPEYMDEFGASLDCLVIGGYYGTGRRGGNLSSFLCGLRVDKPNGEKTTKFKSFFKVGGGMTADDYAKVRHNTQDKWQKYDPKHPPGEFIELAGGNRQVERPDMWIKPEESIVVEVKAASVITTDEYAARVTLRFVRFTRFRADKDWKTALSVEEFQNVRDEAETRAKTRREEDKMRLATRKRKTQTGIRKRQIVVAGYGADNNTQEAVYASPTSSVFLGLTIYIMTESTQPQKKSKLELEDMVKSNGGKIVQSAEIKNKGTDEPEVEVLCVAERKTVKVASLEKRGKKEIVRPIWLFDCIAQGKRDFAQGLSEIVLPYEPTRHLFFCPSERDGAYKGNVDQYGDSYTRDTTAEELKSLMENMGRVEVVGEGIEKRDFLDPSDCRGWMFSGLVFWFDDPPPTSQHMQAVKLTTQFAGARVVDELKDLAITHMVLQARSDARQIRNEIAGRKRLPRIVGLDWVEQCWKEHTRIDEEQYAVV